MTINGNKTQKNQFGKFENEYVAQQKSLISVFQKNFNQRETHYVL